MNILILKGTGKNKMEKIVLMCSSVECMRLEEFYDVLNEREDSLHGWNEEIMRWDISEEKQAREELKKYTCFYWEGSRNRVYGEEYALVFCDCDDDGDIIDEYEYVMAAREVDDSLAEFMVLIDGYNPIEWVIKMIKQDRVTVFGDFEENFDEYMHDWQCDEDQIEKYKKMILTGDPVNDWDIAYYKGKKYYIEYCL